MVFGFLHSKKNKRNPAKTSLNILFESPLFSNFRFKDVDSV